MAGTLISKIYSNSIQTDMEFEIFHCLLLHERRKGWARDYMMDRMWKTIEVIFSIVTSNREIP